MPYTDEYIRKFESVQKQFLLFALRQMFDPRDYLSLPSYEERLKLINLQSLQDRREILIASFIFDILHDNILVDELSDNVNLNNNRQLRHSKYLIEKFHNTEYGRNEPLTRGCRIFNNYIQCYENLTICSKVSYKNNLRKHIPFL